MAAEHSAAVKAVRDGLRDRGLAADVALEAATKAERVLERENLKSGRWIFRPYEWMVQEALTTIAGEHQARNNSAVRATTLPATSTVAAGTLFNRFIFIL